MRFLGLVFFINIFAFELFSITFSKETKNYIDLAKKEYVHLVSPPDLLNYDLIDVEGLGKFHIEKLIHMGLKSNLKAGQIWEPHIIPIFEKFAVPGSVVIDMGACFGVHAVRLSQLIGQDGQVFAFEPQKKMVREMIWNLNVNGVTNCQIFPFAVGRECAFTSLRKVNVQKEGDVRIGKGGQKCRLVALDSFNISNLSFIKIDIENYEYEALVGAEKTINNNRPVMMIELLAFEEPDNPDYINSKKATDWLRDHNYKLYWIPPPHYQRRSYDFLCVPAEKELNITNYREV